MRRPRTNAEALARHRSPARRAADCWGLTPGIAAPATETALVTADGVRLRATYLPGPALGAGDPALAGDPARVPAVVLAPGLAGHRTKPAYALLAEHLAARAAVLAIDLRGHGGSGGRSRLGAEEVHDLAAAVDWLRRRGHRWVGVVGASMGATAALRLAGLRRGRGLDAVAAISPPAVWGANGSPALDGLRRLATVPCYRAVYGAVTHVRIAPSAWTPVPGPAGAIEWRGPVAPLAVVDRIAPVPLLVVHGEDDHLFPLDGARALHAAAGEPRTLWVEPPGFGHAEDGFTPAFADRLAEAVAAVVRTGRWPDRAEPPR